MAEVEVYIYCDGPETREFVERNIAQARNEVTKVFIPLDREQLMSRDGKNEIKSEIVRKLNRWLPSGHIGEAYFSRLILS